MSENKRVKIGTLHVQDFKKVRCVDIESDGEHVVIGGRNEQGKSTLLDAIAYALGGNKFKPSAAQRDGADEYPSVVVELSNGLTVERRGKNGSLHVFDKRTNLSGKQSTLDAFISTIALQQNKFLEGSDKNRANMLAEAIGDPEALNRIDALIKHCYDDRRDVNNQKKRLENQLEVLDTDEALGFDLVDRDTIRTELAEANEILRASQSARRERSDAIQLLKQDREELERVIANAKTELKEIADKLHQIENEATPDESKLAGVVSKLDDDLWKATENNAKIRANNTAKALTNDIASLEDTSAKLTGEIEDCREERVRLFADSGILEGLTVDDENQLTYNGKRWDCMSESDRRIVATHVASKENPKCGFVCVDRLEEFDDDRLAKYLQWLKDEGYQCFGVTVGEREACTLVIEDGMVKE